MATATAPRPKTKAQPDRARRIREVSNHLKQAADPTRLQVLVLLLDGERNVGGMCESLESKQPLLSHHLAGLRLTELVVAERRGKESWYSLTETGRELAKVVRGMVG